MTDVLQDGQTCEVLRVATNGAKNACSMLYGAAARAAKALGYRRIVTYTLAVEPGTILRAAGWSPDGEVRPEDSWASKGRPRYDRDLFGNRLRPTGPKIRWVKYFAAQDKGQRPDAEFPLKRFGIGEGTMPLYAVPKGKRVENPALIRALKGRVLRCEWCGVPVWKTPWPLDVHHVKSRGAGGGDTLDNLVVLCRPCHDQAQTDRIHRAALIALTGPRVRDPFWQAIGAKGA